MLKTCKKCNKEKPISSFYNDKRRKDGAYPNCKECHCEYNRNRHSLPQVKERRKELYDKIKHNPEHIDANKQRSRKFYVSIEGRAKTLLKSAQRRSKKLNKNCEVEIDEIQQSLIKGVCEVTDLIFDFEPTPDGKRNPFAPSIDRIDPSKGYVKGNVRIVIWQYNLMKGELLDHELLKLCKLLVDKYCD